MKRVNLPSVSTKKAYETPLLKALGEVEELTKGLKGSITEDNTVAGDLYEEDAP